MDKNIKNALLNMFQKSSVEGFRLKGSRDVDMTSAQVLPLEIMSACDMATGQDSRVAFGECVSMWSDPLYAPSILLLSTIFLETQSPPSQSASGQPEHAGPKANGRWDKSGNLLSQEIGDGKKKK